MNETKLIKSQTLRAALGDILENDTVLRDKQREAFSKMADKELIEISDGYFRLPTAFGKTVMFSLMARAFLDKVQKKNQRPRWQRQHVNRIRPMKRGVLFYDIKIFFNKCIGDIYFSSIIPAWLL